jgi:hypothetical protein
MTAQEMQAEIERLRDHLDSTRTTILNMASTARETAARAQLFVLARELEAALDPVEAEHERGWAQWRDRVNITR